MLLLQAQSDDDDVGPDDVNVAVEGGYMDEFFSEVRFKNFKIHTIFNQNFKHGFKKD